MNSEINLDRILLAVDGSRSCERATSVAFEIQRSYGSRLVVLSVANIPSHLYGLDVNVAEHMLKEAREILDPIRSNAKQHDVPIEPICREGNPAEMINQIALENQTGLTIIGSHGCTGLKRLLMGSVAERVIGHAPCPVLVTRS